MSQHNSSNTDDRYNPERMKPFQAPVPSTYNAELRPLPQHRGVVKDLPAEGVELGLLCAVKPDGAGLWELSPDSGYKRQTARFARRTPASSPTNAEQVVFMFPESDTHPRPRFLALFVNGRLIMYGGLNREVVQIGGVDQLGPQVRLPQGALRLCL